MKRLLTLSFLMMFAFSSFAVGTQLVQKFKSQPEVASLTPEMLQMSLNKFLTMTPKKYKELTGDKLGIKNTIKLKVAQKYLKKQMKQDPDIEKGLYVLLAILGLGWVAMGVMDDWSGNDWIVNLILTALCWLPGVIHALMKMKKYY